MKLILLFTTVVVLFYVVDGFKISKERDGGFPNHNGPPHPNGPPPNRGKHGPPGTNVHVTHGPGKGGKHDPPKPTRSDGTGYGTDYYWSTTAASESTSDDYEGSNESHILFDNAEILAHEAMKTFLEGLLVFVTDLVNSLVNGGTTTTTQSSDTTSWWNSDTTAGWWDTTTQSWAGSSSEFWGDSSTQGWEYSTTTDSTSPSDLWFSWPDWWHTWSDSWETWDDGTTTTDTTTSDTTTTTDYTTTTSNYWTTTSSILGMTCFPNGFREPCPNHDNYYYKCEKNTVVLKQCPSGQVFDIPSLSCS